MKICYNCDFENFDRNDYCERCNWNISNVRDEIFSIAAFIRRNYQLYAIFGILIGLFTYLFKPEQPFLVKEAGLVPLLVAIYIILHLMNKARQIFVTTQWNHFPQIRRRESFFDVSIFFIFHSFLVIALIATTPFETIMGFGFLSGIFMFLIFFSADFSERQQRIAMSVVLFCIFLIELALLLILSIPTVAAMTDSAIIADVYIWSIVIFMMVAGGGLFAYYCVTMIYGTIFHEDIHYFAIFQRNVDNQITFIEFIMGFICLLGIILVPIIVQLAFAQPK